MFSWSKNSADPVRARALTQQLDFSDDSLGVDQIFESLRYLLDGYLGFDGVVVGRAHHTVGAVSDLLNVLVLVLHQEGGASALERGHSLGHLGLDLLLELVLVLLLKLLQTKELAKSCPSKMAEVDQLKYNIFPPLALLAAPPETRDLPSCQPGLVVGGSIIERSGVAKLGCPFSNI